MGQSIMPKMEKMRTPDDFDNAEEEEDVDENGENGGDCKKVDTIPLVHPAEFVLMHHSEYEKR